MYCRSLDPCRHEPITMEPKTPRQAKLLYVLNPGHGLTSRATPSPRSSFVASLKSMPCEPRHWLLRTPNRSRLGQQVSPSTSNNYGQPFHPVLTAIGLISGRRILPKFQNNSEKKP